MPSAGGGSKRRSRWQTPTRGPFTSSPSHGAARRMPPRACPRFATRPRQLLALAALALAAAVPGAAATTVPGGTIATSTTWSLAGSPYVVQGTVTVGAGTTLTVAAGVQVRFAIGTQLDVVDGGSLVAQGSAGQPVAFTSDVASPGRGDWYYIRAFAGARLRLTHCEIAWAGPRRLQRTGRLRHRHRDPQLPSPRQRRSRHSPRGRGAGAAARRHPDPEQRRDRRVSDHGGHDTDLPRCQHERERHRRGGDPRRHGAPRRHDRRQRGRTVGREPADLRQRSRSPATVLSRSLPAPRCASRTAPNSTSSTAAGSPRRARRQ